MINANEVTNDLLCPCCTSLQNDGDCTCPDWCPEVNEKDELAHKTVMADYHQLVVEKLEREKNGYRQLLIDWVQGAIIEDIGCRWCGEPVQDEEDPEISQAHRPNCLVAQTCASLRGVEWPSLRKLDVSNA